MDPISFTQFTPNLTGVGPTNRTDNATGTGAAGGVGNKKFGDVLKDSIAEVNRLQADADQAINALSVGKTDNVAEVMTAVQKADLAFKTLLQIRNKLLDAYNEVRQMRL
jgi:flagellar hook-basal body complex protein FliE